MSQRRFYALDIETTGLDVGGDLIIEVGAMVLDSDLKVVDTFDSTVYSSELPDIVNYLHDSQDPSDKFVVKMHTENGLFAQALAEKKQAVDVASDLADFLVSHGVSKQDAVLGSSVHFDREFLRDDYDFAKVDKIFSHRNIDVSSFVQMLAIRNPDDYQRMLDEVAADTNHRVLKCLDGSVRTLKWILENGLGGKK